MIKRFLLLVVLILLFSGIAAQIALAYEYQVDSPKVNYYVVIYEIGDYSGTLTLLKTHRKLSPNGYTIYAIQDELDKEAWIAFVNYMDWTVLGYVYRDEVTGEAEIIDAEEFLYYISKIKIEN